MDGTAAWGLVKETFSDWSEDKAPRLAAALAYYTVFALAPLLIIVIAIAGLFFGEEQVRQNIVGQLGGLIGQNGQQALISLIEGARRPAAGLIATAIGVVTLVLAAGGLFGQLQDALNTIWEVQPKPGQGIWATLRARFLSFSMVLGVGFLLLVSLVISAALAAVGQLVAGEQYGQTLIWQIVNFAVSFAITTLLFAMIFKILPDVEVAWSDVWIGAVATAALFALGRLLISLYLGKAAPESSYGAAGSLVAILIWVYYSAQILFMGAEFTQVYARRYGSKIEPAENAVAVTEEARAQQGIPSQASLAGAETRARQVGGGDEAQSDEPVAAPQAGRAAGVGALAAFAMGVILGRRQRADRSDEPPERGRR